MAVPSPPWGLRWRSHTFFICSTVAIGLFSDLSLYGLIVPVLPFMLRDRIGVPPGDIQSYASGLLAVYAGACVLASIPAGWVADHATARQVPFLSGLASLFLATVLLALGQSILVLVVARVLQGISAALVWTSAMAMLIDTVGAGNLGKTIGTIFSFITVGTFVAPVVGGVLYDKTGYWGVFCMGTGMLVVDFFLRLLVIEKKVAARYLGLDSDSSINPRLNNSGDPDLESEDGAHACENDALLPPRQNEAYKIPERQGKLVKSLPLVYCLLDIRFLVALWLAFVQALLSGAFDATIPTEAQAEFDFSSLQAGLLFIPLNFSYLIVAPIAGWAVDKYGTKFGSVSGFGFLVLTLALLRLPTEHVVTGKQNNIILFCAMLTLNGAALAGIGSPSIVESSFIVQLYDKANPGFFGANGPYAQLYGYNSLVYSLGLAVGPLLSGKLRETIGYGNMNAVMAAICAFTAVLSFVYIGEKPRGASGNWK